MTDTSLIDDTLVNRCIGKYCNNPQKDPKKNIWYDCKSTIESPYKYCKDCIKLRLRICTCEKEFITGIPCTILINKDYYPFPDNPPNYFFTNIKGNIWGIKGCRGCKYKEDEILADINKSVKMSISSCIYQKIFNEEKQLNEFEYMSDALDPNFEKHVLSLGIKLGEPANIEVNLSN
jgi:hypothetical protein